MRTNSRKSGMLPVYLAGGVTVVMWGMSFISTKVLLPFLGPVEIYIYRFVLAYLLVLAISHKRFRSHSWVDECLFALCGLTAGSIYFIAENTALEYTLVQNVSLLTSLSPLITALVAALMYSSERVSGGTLIGSAIAFVGVGCVIFNSSSGGLQVNPLGDLLSLGAAFSWTIYSLILRRLNTNYDVWFITRKTFFYGIITALPFLAFSSTISNPLVALSNPNVVLNLLFLGVGASLIGYLLWAYTVRELGAVKANNFMYFQSVVTLVASAILLHEPVTAIGGIGCGLIIGGLWLGDWLTRRSMAKR